MCDVKTRFAFSFIRVFIEASAAFRNSSVLMDQFYAAAELTGIHGIHATS